MLYARKKPVKIVETAFDLAYLSTVFTSAVLLTAAPVGSLRWFFGLLAILLGLGDSLHLVPRMLAFWDSRRNYTAALGLGKLAASLTMTGFYVGLWLVGVSYTENGMPLGTALFLLLAAARAVLSMLPQNRWTAVRPPKRFGVLRNIPFFLMGAMAVWLYAMPLPKRPEGMALLWLWIFVSFACYAPVVFWADQNPKLGMLMLPKSCAYSAIVLAGFALPGV